MKISVCGKGGMEMQVDRYIELTAELGIKKAKEFPSRELEEKTYRTIQKEVSALLGKNY